MNSPGLPILGLREDKHASEVKREQVAVDSD
jgi:hypothetical protein